MRTFLWAALAYCALSVLILINDAMKGEHAQLTRAELAFALTLNLAICDWPACLLASSQG